jgi:hypothetical protein
MTTKVLALIAWIVLLGAAPLVAHHSAAAEFDETKPFKLTGVVTKVRWENPHIFFYMDVADEKTGKTVNWVMEMANPNRLMRAGWTRDTMKIGDKVLVEGTLARDGSPFGNVRSVAVADTGKRLFQGSSEEQ